MHPSIIQLTSLFFPEDSRSRPHPPTKCALLETTTPPPLPSPSSQLTGSIGWINHFIYLIHQFISPSFGGSIHFILQSRVDLLSFLRSSEGSPLGPVPVEFRSVPSGSGPSQATEAIAEREREKEREIERYTVV